MFFMEQNNYELISKRIYDFLSKNRGQFYTLREVSLLCDCSRYYAEKITFSNKHNWNLKIDCKTQPLKVTMKSEY